MLAENTIKLRQVGWNGIRLTVPGPWEAHLGGHNHLIFEEDFSPILEIRWQKVRKRRGNQSRSLFKRIKKTVTTLHELDLPSEWSFLKDRYDVTCYGKLDHLYLLVYVSANSASLPCFSNSVTGIKRLNRSCLTA